MRNTLVHPWMIHPHTGKPLEAVGVVAGRPVWPIMGASDDDDDADDAGGGDDDADGAGDGDDDADDAGDDDDDLDEGKSPEDLKAELARMRKSYAKVLKEKRNLTRGGDKTKTRTKDDGDGKDTFTKDDVEATREETREATRAEMLPAVIRPAARTVLAGLGMQFPKDEDVAKAKLTRTLKLANIDDVELDEDGELVGLTEALREVRRQFPEMFRGTRARTPGNAGGGRRPSTKPKDATAQQAALLFGGGDDD